MDNTSKTSIAAIIFTIMFFLLVIFISLFRGITLYDIKSNNLQIGKIFFKIDKKIILKIKDINISSVKTNNPKRLNFHKTFHFILKTLPIFEKIELKNIYNNALLIKNLTLNKNNINIQTKYFHLKGKFFIKNNSFFIAAKKLSLFNHQIKDLSFISNINKNITSNITGLFCNKNFHIKLNLSNDKIKFNAYIGKFIFSINNINIKTGNITAKGIINLISNKITLNAYSPLINIKNKQISINSFNNQIDLTNSYIALNSKKANILYISNKLYLKNYKLYFYIPQKLLLIHSNISKLNYHTYTLNSKNTEFDYNLKNNDIFLHTNNLKLNNDLNATLKELTIKNNNIYYSLQKAHLVHKYFNLKTDYIKGNLKTTYIANVLGKVLIFNIFAQSPVIKLKQKKAFCKKIIFNKILFNNNKLDFSKKTFKFSSNTNTLFNQNVKEILHYFKIDIPITQLSGKNELNFSIKTDLKNIDANYTLFSKEANFSINPKNRFFYKNMQAKGDLNKTNIILNDFNFTNEFVKNFSDANINININQKYINAFINIKDFKIDEYIDIKNFYEKAVIDLSKQYAYLLNSYIFINIKQKIIYFYNLKSLLKYSIFNEIFENGNIIVKFLKDKIDIYANTVLNYPFILNQKNPKKLNAKITLTNNNIFIKNKFLDTEIINFEKIISYLQNIDIDIQGLLNIINTTKKLAAHKKEKSDKNLKIVIMAKNTNFIYKNHKFLTNKATLIFNKELQFNATYKKSYLKGYTKNNYLLIEGKNYTKESLVPLFKFFNHFNNINLDFVSVKSPDDFYTGKIYIKKASVKDLAALNNIIAFINTIPALLSLKTPGFSAKGYKIKNGFISYLFYNNILYFKQIKIKGININFDAKGYVNLNKNIIKLKIHTIVKLKLKNIPVLGKALSYLFFGKDGYLHINIFVNGDLNNPKVSKDLGGGIIKTPLQLFKRILTLPFHIF